MKNTPQDDDYYVSKSQRKRDMDALQDLGKTLTELPVARLKKVPMSDNLREALVEMARLTANGARARQLQYIGRVFDIWPGAHRQHYGIVPHPVSALESYFVQMPIFNRNHLADFVIK